jgi:hypothetical protein
MKYMNFETFRLFEMSARAVMNKASVIVHRGAEATRKSHDLVLMLQHAEPSEVEHIPEFEITNDRDVLGQSDMGLDVPALIIGKGKQRTAIIRKPKTFWIVTGDFETTGFFYKPFDFNGHHEEFEIPILPDLEKAFRSLATRALKQHESYIAEASTMRSRYDLQEIFDELNIELFDGAVLPVLLKWNTSKNTIGHVLFSGQAIEHLAISDYYDLDLEQIRNVMAHEMIHVYLGQNNIKDDNYHGRQFTRMMNRFNKKGFKIGKTENTTDFHRDSGITRRERVMPRVLVIKTSMLNGKVEGTALSVVGTDKGLREHLEFVYGYFGRAGSSDHFEVYEPVGEIGNNITVTRKLDNMGWYKISDADLAHLRKSGTLLWEIEVKKK